MSAHSRLTHAPQEPKQSSPADSVATTQQPARLPAGSTRPRRLNDRTLLPLGEVSRHQSALTLSRPGDSAEREAERIAEQLTTPPTPSEVEGAPPGIQRSTGPTTRESGATPAGVNQVLNSPGRPLEPALRQEMEQRFGHDFSRVRVHCDRDATRSAREVNATAYTVGHDIVFGAGRFNAGTGEGRRLIAHELTHVVQQSGGAPAVIARHPTDPPFAVNQQDITNVRSKMLEFYNLLSADARESLQRNTTVVIALVTHDNEPTMVYTVASNSINPAIREAMDKLGITRWDPEGIDKEGGERHAEQLTTESARRQGFKVHAIAVTRVPCADCGPVIADEGIPIEWVRDPNPRPKAPPTTPAPATRTGGVPQTPDEPPPTGTTPTQSPGGKTQAVVGQPLEPVAEHGPSATGAAAFEGGVLALQLAGSLLNHFGEQKQAELAYEALKPSLQSVNAELTAHPDKGVLISYRYEQVTASPDSVVQPSPTFLSVGISYGLTETEAVSNMPNTLKPGPQAGHRIVEDTVWVPPQQLNPAAFATPFPKLALARFKPGKEELHKVKWIKLDLNRGDSESFNPDQWGWRPLFFVLQVPSTIEWVWQVGDIRHTDISLKSLATANGFTVQGADGLVPIFAADENTFNFFQAARDFRLRDNLGQLHYTNLEFTRWAAPEDIEVIKILSNAGVQAAPPSLEDAELQKELANLPKPVRDLYEVLTQKGDTVKSGKLLERFLTVVPSDLTADEVEILTDQLKKSKNVDKFLDSLEKAIQNLPTRSGGNQLTTPGGATDFRKATKPDYAPAALTEQIRVKMDGLDWGNVQPELTYFDNVIGKEGTAVDTLAYGLDDEGRHWGALVTVAVSKKDGGFTPVKVLRSTVLVSEQGEALYGNSVLIGRTFRLKPEK